MYVGHIKSIRFEPFVGMRFPPKHPRSGELVPTDTTYYALPGGGVAMKPDIQTWATEYGCTAVFTYERSW